MQLDTLVVGASDKRGAYLQSSAAAQTLFNKWGQLGVANRALLWRAFDDLAQAAAWQVERGDWAGAIQTAEKLLTLELFEQAPNDAGTGKGRIELGVDAKDLRLPSRAVELTMHREGEEPAAASKLAQAWLSKLPAYIAGPVPREEKLRIARLSQLLGVEVFAIQPGRLQTIAVAVDAVRGTYGPSALAVFPQFVDAVEAAKRERVARQVQEFSQVGAPNAPVANAPIANMPSLTPRAGTRARAEWMDREPLKMRFLMPAPSKSPPRPLRQPFRSLWTNLSKSLSRSRSCPPWTL